MKRGCNDAATFEFSRAFARVGPEVAYFKVALLMVTGFNTDFKFKGKVYHVQTEDNGVSNPVIVTLLYQGGAILASRKTSYADIIKYEHLARIVKQLMEDQHKQIIKDLVAGKFVEAGGAAAVEEIMEAEPVDENFGADVISDKSLDEVILDYLSSDEDNK